MASVDCYSGSINLLCKQIDKEMIMMTEKSLEITLAEVKTPARRKYPPSSMNDCVIKPHGG
jgi:hypothetical protein